MEDTKYKYTLFGWMGAYFMVVPIGKHNDDSFGDEYQNDEITDEMYAEQERRQKEMLRQLQEEERQKWNEQREEQRRKDYGYEILPDGTQHCPGEDKDYYSNVDSSDRRAQEHAAERKRSRIEENMENAQIVNAVDVDEAAERAAEEKRQRKAADRLRLEEERAAEEAKRRVEEAERHRKVEEEARAEAKRQARLLRKAEEDGSRKKQNDLKKSRRGYKERRKNKQQQ